MTTFECSLNYTEEGNTLVEGKILHGKILTDIMDGMGFEQPSSQDFATLVYSPPSKLLSVLYRNKSTFTRRYAASPRRITSASRSVRVSIDLAFGFGLVYRAGEEHKGPLPSDQLGDLFVARGVLSP